MSEIPKYQAVERCFLKPVGYAVPILVEIGQEVQFTGTPGMGLRPLNAAARTAKASSIRTAVLDSGPQQMQVRRRMARSLGHDVRNSVLAREHIDRFINAHAGVGDAT